MQLRDKDVNRAPSRKPIVCDVCKKSFGPWQATQKTCSKECRYARTRSLTLPLKDRFWSYVRPGLNGCWLWRNCAPNKYGQIVCDDGIGRRANRVSWTLTYGPIPDGLVVCHHCDTPACVRPDHLFLGTVKDNAQDAKRKNRLKGMPGIANPIAKLTDDVVRRIRLLKETTSYTQIAREIGVSRATVSGVARGIKWRHVA